MRRSLFLACVLSSLTVFASPRAARADDAAVKEAQARFDEGVSLADAGKNEEARLKFTQAVAVLKAPAVLFNLARVEQLTGHELEALDHYKQFLRAAQNDPKVTDALREKTRGYIAELSRKAGQIELDAPPEARVSVDGRPVEERNAADPLHVSPGRHTLEGSYQGRVKSVVVECPAGVVIKAKLDFDGPVTEPPPGGEDRGFWTTGRAVGLGLGIAGVGALVGGAVVFAGASGKSDDAAALRATLPDARTSCATGTSPACGDLRTLEDDYKTGRTVGSVLMISGGVLAVGGAALFVVSSPKGSSPTRGTSRIIPIASAREAGLSWVGTF